MKNPPRECHPEGLERSQESIWTRSAHLRIILLRHGERTGIADDRGLSPSGKQRSSGLAIALPQYFGPIGSIIAARSTLRSARPTQTVEPLASALGIPIDERWGTNDYGKLAHDLVEGNYEGSSVLICWRHKTLQQLAQRLGVHDAPPWPETLYERIWLLTALEGRTACTEFRTLMEKGRIQIVPSGIR